MTAMMMGIQQVYQRSRDLLEVLLIQKSHHHNNSIIIHININNNHTTILIQIQVFLGMT